MPHDLTATPPVREPRIGNYQLLHTLGEGAFAKVKLARHIPTGVEVAVKIIDRQGAYRPLQEIRTMKSLNHPHIIKLYESISTVYTVFIIMEHASRGSLSEHLQRFGRMQEPEAQRIFRQLISAVQYCHEKGIIHRDLKSGNVLLDEEMNVKLADFGLSSGYVGRQLRNFCGSVPYVAPEVFLRQGYDGPGADVWSLGVILYEIITGKRPFTAKPSTMLPQKILTGQYRVPYFASFLCQNVLKKILTVDPANRASLEQLMKDPWVNMGQEELQPYTELPSDSVNPQVVQEMLNLGYERREIEEVVAGGKDNSVLGTYLILEHRTPKVKCRTIKVKPFPAAEPFLTSYGPSLTNSDQPSGQEAKEAATPPASLDSRTATPGPALQSGPVDSSSIYSTCRNFSGEAPAGLEAENAHPAEQPDGVTPPSSVGHCRGCRGLLRRFCNFVVRHVRSKPSAKKRRGKLGKWAQVKPM